MFYEADEEGSCFFDGFSFFEGSEQYGVDGVVEEIVVDVDVFYLELEVSKILLLHHYQLELFYGDEDDLGTGLFAADH